MPVIHSTTDTEAIPSAVWDLLCDVVRYPDWVVAIDTVLSLPADGLRLGATYREAGGIAPFKGTTEWLVTEFDALRQQVLEGSDGRVRMHFTVDLSTTEHGARISQRLRVTPRWFIAPLFYATWLPFMRRRTQAALDQTGVNMQRLLEADA